MGSLHTKDLAPGVDRYVFLEHTVEGMAAARTPLEGARTFVVLRGTVELAHAGDHRRYQAGEGWHAPAGAVYGIGAAGTVPAVLIEAGSVRGGTTAGRSGGGQLSDLSRYTVDKPWGDEIWYTENLDAPEYALKRIRMTAGHQSSLQSHRYKAETNYVVEGEATVLAGLAAPDDPGATVDVARLTTTVYGPGTGWSSPPGELHRVIARRDYTAIEVSTPELDDVVRWQDDTGRGHGRISTEHAGGQR